MRPTLFAAVLLSSASALAQSYDLYGVGPRTVAMAGTQGAAEDDWAAAFYNPALLRGGAVGFSFRWSKPLVHVTQEGDALPTQQLEPRLPPDFAGWSLGFAVPMVGLLADKATVGVAVFLPHRQVFRTVMVDESTPYFLRYDNAPARIQMALSAAARPWPWLSLGAGVQVMTDYSGDADFTAVLGTTGPGRVTKRDLASEVKGVAAPLIGLEVGPFKGVRAFAAWRGQLLAVYSLPITVDLGQFGALDVLVKGVSHFAPHNVSAGASATLLEDRLFLTFDVSWEHWSAVPSLVADMSIGLAGTLTDLGFHEEVLSRPIAMGFADTVTPRVAAEWKVLPRLALRLGYGLRPSPIPPQTGDTNFLDATTHLVTLGGGYTFDDPLRMAKGLSVDLGAQLAVLHDGLVTKSGPNRVANYRYGGANLTVTAGVGYDF